MRRDVTVVTEDDTAETAASIMREENVGFLPVVSDVDSRRLVGVVTDRDLAMAVVAENREPRMTRVGYIMTREPITIAPWDGVREAERRMADAEVRRLPVVDEDGLVLGVLSLHDLAQREDTSLTGEVFRAVARSSSRL